VALSPQSFSDFSQTLQALWERRKELMGGIGGLDGFDEGSTEGVGGLGGKDDGKGTEDKRKAIWMRKQWREAEVAGEVKKEGGIVKPCEGNEKDGWLDFEGVLGVCRRLNIASSRRDLLQRFQVRCLYQGFGRWRVLVALNLLDLYLQEADIDRQGHLDFVSFQRFVKELKRRPEVENLFAQLTPGEGLDEKAFAKFMTETQKVRLLPSEAIVLS
jgi:phosphatidylinositol phospholipase C delta